MSPRDFRSVRAALVESDAQARSDMRIALLEKGIREPASCKTADSLLDVAAREFLDLVVCDSQAFEGEFAPTMQQIRRNAVGGNPFVVVIATLSDTSHDHVQSALDSGVDDLVRKPASAMRVVGRIDALVKGRRPFIATRNYVGPTRATLVQAGSEVSELIEVPNTLRAKVVDKHDEKRLRRIVSKAAVALKEKMAEHPLAGIDRLIDRALAWHGASDSDQRRQFGNLHALSFEISSHYHSAAYTHIAKLALALSKLADKIAQQSSASPSQVEVSLLRHLGVVVKRTMESEHGASSVVEEIAIMVDRFASGAVPRPTYH
jgi:DNA-binding response OmpR family regulator